MTARFMRGNFFTFTPSFKLTFTGNHTPDLRNVDAAMSAASTLLSSTIGRISQTLASNIACGMSGPLSFAG